MEQYLLQEAADILLLRLGVVHCAAYDLCFVSRVGAQHLGAIQRLLVPLEVLDDGILEQHASGTLHDGEDALERCDQLTFTRPDQPARTCLAQCSTI